MLKRFAFVFGMALLGNWCLAQGPRPGNLGASKLDLGQPGIQWYTTWESAEAGQSVAGGRSCLLRLPRSVMGSPGYSDRVTPLRRTVCSRPLSSLMQREIWFVYGWSRTRVLSTSSMCALSSVEGLKTVSFAC